MIVSSFLFDANLYVTLTLAITGCLLLFFSGCFQYLRVRDGGDHLEVRYGPIPVFSTTFPYEKISQVQIGQSRFIDGWGVHWVPGRGWTYNLWGWDCVEFRLNNTPYRIGTDDPEGLASFLQERTGAEDTSTEEAETGYLLKTELQRFNENQSDEQKGILFRSLLRHDLYVMGESSRKDEFVELSEESQIHLKQWQFGEEWIVPAFTSLEVLQNVIEGEEPYIQLYSRDLLSILDRDGDVFVLNPGTDAARKFSQTEIKGLLDGSIFPDMLSFQTDEGQVGYVGPSPEHPENLEQRLISFFMSSPAISTAYIAQLYLPSSGQPPHPVVSVEGEGNLLNVMAEADMRARESLPEGSLIDFRKLGNDPISEFMREQLTPFFNAGNSSKDRE